MRLNLNHRCLVFAFFIVLLLIGILIYRDYGVSYDEACEYNHGLSAFNFFFKGQRQVVNPYYGAGFNVPLFIIPKILKLEDIRDIFLIRHLLTFLLFYISLICFYKLGRGLFKSPWLALLGTSFLVLSPRIFADAFYNSKDLGFLSVFIIGIYSLFKYLDRPDWRRAAVHGLISAWLINIRLAGLLVPFFTVIFIGVDLIKIKLTAKQKTPDKLLASLFLYGSLTVILTILFWPIMWENPVYHFIEALKTMAHYPWQGETLYLGKFISAADVPWHYLPVWIIITTPLLYLGLGLIGAVTKAKELIQNRGNFWSMDYKKNIMVLIWLFWPIILVIILGSNLYDGWRQMYFIYPAMVILAIYGLMFIYNIIKLKLGGKIRDLALGLLIAITAGSLLSTGYTMIKTHPYYNVYFNGLARKIFQPMRPKFELDYWGLSYHQAVEYILENDDSDRIKIFTDGYPGELASWLLTVNDRERAMFVSEPEQSDYLLSNYRWHPEEYEEGEEAYNIIVGGEKILTARKIRQFD